MNKLTVLSANVKTYFMRRLIEEVGDRLQIINPFERTALPLSQNVLVRTFGVQRGDQDLDLIEQFSSDVKIVNPLPSLKTFRSKTSQYEFFASTQIPHLPWADLSLKLPDEFSQFLKISDELLVKPRRGMGGWGIRVLSQTEFRSWWLTQKSLGDTDYVLQPFLKDAEEFRIFFAGTFRLCLKRNGVSGVAANFTAGGSAEISRIPENVCDEVEKLIGLSGAHYGGIDLLVKKDQASFLELNVVPGIEQAEALSGENLIARILSGIIA